MTNKTRVSVVGFLFIAALVFALCPTSASAAARPDWSKTRWSGAKVPRVFVNDWAYYRLEGANRNIQLRKDGIIQFNSADEIYIREYAFHDGKIVVTDDGEPYITLTILDLCTLTDEDGNTYSIPDSAGQELKTYSIYYANAETGAGNLMFMAGGMAAVEDADGKQLDATYEVNDDMVLLDIDGNTLELKIVNSRILRLDDDTVFVRPDY